MAELSRTQIATNVKRALDWIVSYADSKAGAAQSNAISVAKDDAKKNYLPLAGGTLNGPLFTKGGFYRVDNSSSVSVNGGSEWTGGASVLLNGRNNENQEGKYKGAFQIKAQNATNRCDLLVLKRKSPR